MISCILISCLYVQAPQTGMASYYADRFDGLPTASGEAYRKDQLTAAHRTLPFGTMIKITNLKNGKFIIARVNDRGPHVKGRIVDVSKAAAEKLGFIRQGVARVQVEVVRGENQ